MAESKYATIREVDKLEENLKTEIGNVTEKVDKVHDCLDGARKDITHLKLENSKQTSDIEHIKKEMEKAEESRSRLHSKFDELNEAVKPQAKGKPANKHLVIQALDWAKQNPTWLVFALLLVYIAPEKVKDVVAMIFGLFGN